MEQNRKKALEYVGDDIVMKEFEEAIENKTQDKTIVEEYDKEWEWTDLGRQKGRLEGKEEGRQEGEAIGDEKGRIATAKNMMKDNLPLHKIVKYTQLAEEEILSIKNTLNESET